MLTHVDQALVRAAGSAYRDADTSLLERVVRQQADMYACHGPTIAALQRITVSMTLAKRCLAVVDSRYHLEEALKAAEDAWLASIKNPKNAARPKLTVIRGGRPLQ
jgi:hypothetical protein